MHRRRLLTIVQPATLLRWHRTGFRLFWRWKAKPRGRPRVPPELQQLIKDMALANRTWGEERIAAELRLKRGIRVSPRTVRRYMPAVPPSRRGRPLAWSTFVRNHAHGVLACDFFVVATATFRLCYLIGTIRRECLDFMIPPNERHLRWVLTRWVAHYNRGRRMRASGRAFRSRRRLSLST
jgi:hypothetical protein